MFFCSMNVAYSQTIVFKTHDRFMPMRWARLSRYVVTSGSRLTPVRKRVDLLLTDMKRIWTRR